ncbi:MAG TPA: helix-turn-helix domain-containing protein [Vicinamibacterales bacterium]|jgi:transcriptional regulator with XRE-family HTH domain|nr:helix-turn-helix domain-containing protein [Vicinamibacterales bacterium]
MSEPTTLGSWLRRERERRGVTLAKISEETKVSVPLLQGLEADDLSRWPGGIFRRAFVRSYASAIGLDPELAVRRVEEEHPSEPAEPAPAGGSPPKAAEPPERRQSDAQPAAPRPTAGTVSSVRAPAPGVGPRIQAVALDLLVAGAIGFGFAAAGSRLLWPVIAIAAYHALGLLLTGTTPMMALLAQAQPAPEMAQPRAIPAQAAAPVESAVRRAETEPRHVRRARGRRSARSEQPAGRH